MSLAATRAGSWSSIPVSPSDTSARRRPAAQQRVRAEKALTTAAGSPGRGGGGRHTAPPGRAGGRTALPPPLGGEGQVTHPHSPHPPPEPVPGQREPRVDPSEQDEPQSPG